MRKALLLVVGLALPVSAAVGVGVSRAQDAEETKPKYEIKQVMQQAHRDKLLNKVRDGEATQEEKVKLLDLYISLTESKPPKGEAASWSAKTNAAVVAAAKAVAGRKDASASLMKAVNCGACHRAHRG